VTLLDTGKTTLASRVSGLRGDPLVANSAYVMLSTASMAGLGFVFWILTARFFSAAQVGEATSLLSATALISYLSLLGFNSTFVRFLPQSTDRNTETNTGFLFVAASALLLSLGYVLAIPLLAPRLDFVHQSIPDAIGFIGLTAAAAVNLVTDSVFIAYRSAKYNLLVDGVVQSGTKVALPAVFIGLGTFGIFLASGAAAVVAVALSIFFLIKRFDYHPELRISGAVIRRVWAYSASNYTANVFNLLPILVLPLLVLDRLGAATAGYYYVAFQVANLFNAIAYAVSQTLLAEGGHGEVAYGRLVRRSAVLQIVIIAPAAGLLCVAGPYLLAIFGPAYRSHASGLLIVLAAAVPAVALNTWTSALLRITKQLQALVWSNVVYAVVVCGLTALWAERGLLWIGVAWLLGNLVSAAIGGVALLSRAATEADNQGAPVGARTGGA